MFLKNALLLSMILVYFYAIYSVYYYFKKSDGSISSILKDENCNKCVLNTMTIMCLIAFLYEIVRDDIISLVLISYLIVGIYGVLMFDFTTFAHYNFAFVAFLSIILFMYYHSFVTSHYFLFLLFFLEILLSVLTILNTEILHYEIYLLANFAFFYIFLHFL
jgi:hypothetical protein